MEPGRAPPPLTPGFGQPEPRGLRAATLGTVLGLLAFAFARVRGAYFVQDDLLNFAQLHARGGGVTRRALLEPLFGHFAPVHRLLDAVVGAATPPSWPLALGIELVFLGVALLALERSLALLRGPSWAHLGLLVLCGGSAIAVVPLRWWASALHVFPGLCFWALALLCFLRFHAGRRPRALLGMAVCLALGLCAYEKPLLLSAEAVALVLLYGGWRAVWRERAAWAVFAGVGGLFLALFFARYHEPSTVPPLRMYLEFLREGWVRGFAPAVFGMEPSGAGRVLGQVVLGGLVALSVAWDRRAWRAWAFFAFAFVLNASAVSLGRLVDYGPGIGAAHRYLLEVPFLFAVALALAFQRGGEPRRWHGAVAAVVVVAYLGQTWVMYGRLDREWLAGPTQRYLERFQSDVAALGERGEDFSILDGEVPWTLLDGWFWPWTRHSRLLPPFQAGLTFDDPSRPLYRVEDDGHLAPVKFDSCSPVTLPEGGWCSGMRPLKLESAAGSTLVLEYSSSESMALRLQLGTREWEVPLVPDAFKAVTTVNHPTSGESLLLVAPDVGQFCVHTALVCSLILREWVDRAGDQ